MIKQMRTDQLSDTYKLLYEHIIGELLSQIFTRSKLYCINNEAIPFIIEEKFEKYKKNASKRMFGTRLDRHKLASCICGAIIEAKPLAGYKGADIPQNANEMFALTVGSNVIKFYMMYDFLHKLDASPEEKYKIREYIKENFIIQYPSLNENICDTHEYKQNIYNALLWSHPICNFTKKECFQYDIWAYSKIFYHLELYNRKYFEDIYKQYIEQR